jgi:hypothetical protein
MKVFRSISLPPYGKIALKRVVQETSQFPKSAVPNLDGALRMREFLTKNSWLATKKLPRTIERGLRWCSDVQHSAATKGA